LPLGVEPRACAVCGSWNKRLLFCQRFEPISEATILLGYDVVACKSCGFCYADNIPGQETFDAYYRSMSKYEHQDRGGKASDFEIRQFPSLASAIAKHIPSPRSRILEIGCANGGLLGALRDLGYSNVLGIDPSPSSPANAWRLYQIRVMSGTLSCLPAEIGTCDFIILVAVLEHIRDLEGAMRRIRDLGSPNGCLFVEIPDVARFPASPVPPFQEFSVEHINFFSSVSLANLLGAYGFTELQSSRVAYNQTGTQAGYAVRSAFCLRPEGRPPNPVHDGVSEPSLVDYIAASRAVEAPISQVISRLVASREPVVIWGVGTQTQHLLATSNLAQANIVAFVDSNPHYQGKRLKGIPVLAPGDMRSRSEAILVSSQASQAEIVRQIRTDLGLTNPVLTLSEG
jgi:SAM-dependent methyltransferase